MLDIIIKHGRIIDGTGSPWYQADIGIKNGVICSIGRIHDTAVKVISARHLTVAPGFIDIHTHSEKITSAPRAENFLRQGVTTVVSGNCGDSILPVRDHLDEVAKTGPGVNYATLAGHGAIRNLVMGCEYRAPDKKELSAMVSLAEKAMDEGALGISTGLIYVPGAYAGQDELLCISKSVAARGGVYATHARSAGGKLFDALEEAAFIGEKASIPVEISHLKVLHKTGRTNRDRADKILEAVEKYRQAGIDLSFDVHPYPATYTTLASVIIPSSASADGKLRQRLGGKAFRDEIAGDVAKNIAWMGGPEKIIITGDEHKLKAEPVTLGRIAESSKKNYVQTAMDLIEQGNPRAVFHALREEDVKQIILSPSAMFASDGGIRHKKEFVHPRYYGTFPRIIREYVREQKLLRLEDAVMRMTSFPARKFNIPYRGLVQTGMRADIAVFDPGTFSDTATFTQPASYPVGLRWVLVNGKIAWNGRNVSKIRHGEIVKKIS